MCCREWVDSDRDCIEDYLRFNIPRSKKISLFYLDIDLLVVTLETRENYLDVCSKIAWAGDSARSCLPTTAHLPWDIFPKESQQMKGRRICLLSCESFWRWEDVRV